AGVRDAALAAPPDEADEPDEPDEERLVARLDVDRARLAVYELSASARAALLERHAERQKGDSAAAAEQQLSEAERKAKDAEEEQGRALEAARKARSEAARVVAEEKARLLGVKKKHAEVEGELIRREQALRERNESILGWRRRVAKVVDALRDTGRPDTEGADRLRADVFAALSEVRQQMAAALDAVGAEASEVPATGANPLDEIAVEVDRTEVDALRTEIEKAEQALRAREAKLQWGRAEALLDELETLSAHRLTLIPHLSADRRDAVTGFGGEGRSVARTEVAQVWLVLRYHLLATEKFITDFRRQDEEVRGSALVAAWVGLKWLLPFGVFVWWRRRAPNWLERWRDRADEESRARGRAKGSSRSAKVASFLLRIRSPLEWLVLVWAVIALLPTGARSLLEVELLWTAAAWALGGLLVVDVIDALFATGENTRRTGLQTAHLRLRSLRWIGRAVVTFGLVLALTTKLVGQGTIYSWVWSTCWWAALPIGLVIVAWWRPVIYERLSLLRKKGVVVSWVEGQADTLGSYPAATVGGAYLLGWGAARRVRSFVGRFDTTRKALAYLFRREIAKQAERRAEAGIAAKRYEPLGGEKYAALSPAKPSTELVASVADKQVEDVIARIDEPGGGVFALVGERGGGKSTLLVRIRDQTDDTTLVRCPMGGIADFHKELRSALGLAEDASVEDVRVALDKGDGDNALLVDDAHRLIHPVIGGLAEIDGLLELARISSASCTWVFAFDAVIWQYFERAREPRPLFDDVIALKPWSEEGIVGLLGSRSALAGVDPRFDDLVSELPEGADEIDREEARARTRAGFYRLLWDYARGNPGVASTSGGTRSAPMTLVASSCRCSARRARPSSISSPTRRSSCCGPSCSSSGPRRRTSRLPPWSPAARWTPRCAMPAPGDTSSERPTATGSAGTGSAPSRCS
ncbi:MAG: AAA family ATPase, partial [Deltaproteobacteria bacterium]|nr:AAA family ATPase [Deltaproteobacteria bacterium]MBW2535283.1 AAA family ATPase [Deltaproteobacteria bacterium]